MIKKASEIINTDKKIRLLIAGYPGIGKTTLALSAPKPLLIDVDRGTDRVKQDTEQILFNLILMKNCWRT